LYQTFALDSIDEKCGLLRCNFNIKLRLLLERVLLVSKRFFGVPSFFNHAIADGIYNPLFPDKTVLWGLSATGSDDFQLILEFG